MYSSSECRLLTDIWAPSSEMPSWKGDHMIHGLLKKYPTWFFSAETNEAWEVCCGREVEDTFICICGFFPISRQHQSRAASVWVRVYTQHASHSVKMTEWLEQQYCIKFCQKLGDSQVETIRKIQRVFGDDGMGITHIKKWYNRFKDGGTLVERNARSGRPSTSRNDELIDQVRPLVMQDRRVTVWELAEEVGISTGSVHSILTDNLVLRRVSAKFILELIQTFLAKHNIPVVQQAPYSPDVAPCDY